jgi:diguanylate cyclase (GGDEF)-like protein
MNPVIDWQGMAREKEEALFREQTISAYRETIERSPNAEDIRNNLSFLLKKEKILVDSLSIIRRVSPPSRTIDLVQLIEADGVYENHRGGIFESQQTLSGHAISTRKPHYAAIAGGHPTMLLPEEVSGAASEYAVPIRYESKDQNFVGAVVFRREGINTFAPPDLRQIDEFMQQIIVSLGLRLALTESTFDPACRTILRPDKTREAFDEEYSHAKKHHSSYAIATLDLNDLKAFNSSYGHPRTNDILYVFGEVIRHAVRGSDVVGRLGGDEFGIGLVLRPGNDAEDIIREKIEKIRTCAAELGLQDMAKKLELPPALSLTFSTGVGLYESKGGVQPNTYDILQKSDEALYASKTRKYDPANLVIHKL